MFSKYIEQAYQINIFKRTSNIYKQTKDENAINTMVNDKVQFNSHNLCNALLRQTRNIVTITIREP